MNQPSTTPLPNLPTTLTRRRVALLLGLALLTVLLLLSLGGGQESLDALTTVKPSWIGLAILIHYSGFAVRGLRWQQLLRVTGYRLSWRYTTTLLLSGWFVSALLPARAGDLLRIGVLRLETEQKPAIPVADSLSSIVLERALDLLALILLGVTVGFLLLQTQLPNWVMVAYATGTALLFLIGVTLMIAPTLLQQLQPRIEHPLGQKVFTFVIEVIASLRALAKQPATAALVLVESLYIWFCDALLLWMVLRSMDVVAGLGNVTFVALTNDIFAAIPITPGGIGQIEAIMAALLTLVPLPPLNIAATVLVSRAISYWSFLLFSGLITFGAGIGQLVLRGDGRWEDGRQETEDGRQ